MQQMGSGRQRGADVTAGIVTRRCVLYCGCCPTTHCPNVGPADRALRETATDRGVVLDLPTNLRVDWVDKGFPIEPGKAS